MKIKEINLKKLNKIVRSFKPIGLFFHRHSDDLVIGIDNSTGDCWTEEFEDVDECKKWLRREKEV